MRRTFIAVFIWALIQATHKLPACTRCSCNALCKLAPRATTRLGGFIKRGGFFLRRIFCRCCCCFLFALAIFNNSSEFGCSIGVGGCAGGPSLPLTLICGHIARAHKSGLFASLSQPRAVHFIRFISCGRLPFDLQFPFPFQWRFDWPCGLRLTRLPLPPSTPLSLSLARKWTLL